VITYRAHHRMPTGVQVMGSAATDWPSLPTHRQAILRARFEGDIRALIT
jgi:hypothetical protein